jgi:DNA-binding NarL/FixJ family response regulator
LSRRGLAEPPDRPQPRAVTSPILAASDEPFRNRVLERLLAAGVDDLQVADLPSALADLLRDSERSIVVVGGEWGATRPFLRVAVNSGALPVVLLESGELDAEGEAFAMGARAALQSDVAVASLAAALTAVNAGLLVLEPSARAILQSHWSAGVAPSVREAATASDARPTRHVALSHDASLLHDAEPARGGRPPREAWPSHYARPPRNAGAARDVVLSHDVSLPRDTELTRGARLPRESYSARDAEDFPPRRSGRPLTNREREILALVASGTANKGIARALGVSANTVKFHLAAVFDKLNVATRAEAVAEAIRRGELSL